VYILYIFAKSKTKVMSGKALLYLLAFPLTMEAATLDVETSDLPMDAWKFGLGELHCAYKKSEEHTLTFTCSVPYGVPSLGMRSARICTRYADIDWQAELAQSGNEDWSETYQSLFASKALGTAASIHLSLHRIRIRTLENRSLSGIWATVGLAYQLNQDLEIGCRIENPTGTPCRSANEKMERESSAQIGLQYHLQPRTTLFTEVDWGLHRNPLLHLAWSYTLSPYFELGGGLHGSPLRPSWALKGKCGHWTYSYGGSLHPTLGIGTCVTLGWSWK
jgi:hypothetical protein